MVYWRWINLMKMSKWYDLLKVDIIYGLLKIRVTATESRIYSFIAYSSKYSHMDVKWRRVMFLLYSFARRASCTSPSSYNLDLRSSSLAIVPRWTSSGPSAIRSVLAVAHRCDKTVSDETPAAPWTCIAMSSTFRAIFGAATCMEAGQLHWIVLLKLLKKKVMTKKLGLLPWPSRGYHVLSCSHVDRVDRQLQGLKALPAPVQSDTALGNRMHVSGMPEREKITGLNWNILDSFIRSEP